MPESNLPAELAAKRQALRGILRRLGRVLVAYSGGVDSGLLLAEATAVLGAENALGVIARSRLMPDEEFRAAVRLAEERGFALRVMEYDEMAIGGFVANEEDRCYHCKTELLKRFSAIAREWGARRSAQAIIWTTKATSAPACGRWRKPAQAVRCARRG